MGGLIVVVLDANFAGASLLLSGGILVRRWPGGILFHRPAGAAALMQRICLAHSPASLCLTTLRNRLRPDLALFVQGARCGVHSVHVHSAGENNTVYVPCKAFVRRCWGAVRY